MIRRAVAADLDMLLDLHRGYCLADEHPFDEARVRRGFVPLLDDDEHGVVWIVDDPGAYAVLTWGWSIEAGGPESVLDEIYVSEPGRGIGAALIDHLLADARSRGLARVFLETERANERARTLYRRHGFIEESSIWMSHPFVALS